MANIDTLGSETAPEEAAGKSAGQDPRKRRQIIAGARDVFLSRGFDASSMDDIARAAGVSKGTLYVYFENKESLFNALIEQESAQQAENLFRIDHTDHDVPAVLLRLGLGFVDLMTMPGKLSSVRVVISIAERMPELGAEFYKVGPCVGAAKLKAYLDAQVAHGGLRPHDTEHAATQFLDLCLSGVMKPLLFGYRREIPDDRKRYGVESAVRVFMAAYGPEPA